MLRSDAIIMLTRPSNPNEGQSLSLVPAVPPNMLNGFGRCGGALPSYVLRDCITNPEKQ